MIPQAELDRALARWKARKLGHDVSTHDASDLAVHEEPTRVAEVSYQSRVETPPAEVNLDDGDYEDHTRR